MSSIRPNAKIPEHVYRTPAVMYVYRWKWYTEDSCMVTEFFFTLPQKFHTSRTCPCKIFFSSPSLHRW